MLQCRNIYKKRDYNRKPGNYHDQHVMFLFFCKKKNIMLTSCEVLELPPKGCQAKK